MEKKNCSMAKSKGFGYILIPSSRAALRDVGYHLGQTVSLVHMLFPFSVLKKKSNIHLIFSSIYLVPTMVQALENRAMNKMSIVPTLADYNIKEVGR